MPAITLRHHAVMMAAGAALAAMIFATPVAHADEPTAPTESTSNVDPTSGSTATSEPTSTGTATAEPTSTATAEPTKTETEKPVATATVTITKTETATPTTIARPGRDEPVTDPCDLAPKYRPATCPTVHPTITVAPR